MILFRCDSSLTIGTGHLFRCRALADRLRELGHSCRFVCRDLPGHASGMLEAAGYPVVLLGSEGDELAALRAMTAEWLIIDHYDIGAGLERALKDQFQIFILDDLHNRPHDCSVLLDQNYHPNSACYDTLVPPRTIRLLGPSYSLLRDEFRHGPPANPKGADPNVLVFFGGADPTGETARFLDAADSMQTPLRFKVLVTRQNPGSEAFRNRQFRNCELHFSPPNLSDLMRDSRLFFGSGGTITWERMALGLPGVVVSVADNQTEIASDLAREGHQKYLGLASAVDYRHAIKTLETVAFDCSWLTDTSRKNQGLVRSIPVNLIEAIFGNALTDLRMRVADETNASFLFELRNDPESRRMFLSTDKVGWQEHTEWFERALSTPGFRIYVSYLNGIPCGQFRVRPDGDTSVGVHPLFRGRQLSSQIINAGTTLYRAEFPNASLSAKIRLENPVSARAFEKAGYVFSRRTSVGGMVVDELDFRTGGMDK